MSTNPQPAALYRVQGRSNRIVHCTASVMFSVTFHYDSPSLTMVVLAAITIGKDFDRRFLITRIVGFYLPEIYDLKGIGNIHFNQLTVIILNQGQKRPATLFIEQTQISDQI